ncbi:MAG: hypothetical protein Marn2KO_23060 [Marinobacter nauticus]
MARNRGQGGPIESRLISLFASLFFSVPTAAFVWIWINLELARYWDGFLRMGLELLKCAFEETYPDADLNYLFDKKSDFGIEHLAIDELQFEFLTS